MDNLVQISINDKLIEQAIQPISQQQIDGNSVVWDIKTLCEKICMSRNVVENTFFWLPDFPKFKVGKKWYIRAEEAMRYLIELLKNQRRV